MKTQPLSLLACLAIVSACNSAPPAPAAPAAPAPSSETLPPGHPPVGDQKAPGAAPTTGPAPTGPATAGGLTWDDFAPLTRRAPKSQMRAAEYGIEGDDKSELTVFYFGEGQGGDVEANISRWLGQFTQPDGSDTAAKSKRSTMQVSGMDVSLVETSGNFSGGMGMQPSAAPPSGEYALLGAIAKGPKGSVFFKLTGPRPSVEKARLAFSKMMGSLRPAS
jgi:hypothetical protein